MWSHHFMPQQAPYVAPRPFVAWPPPVTRRVVAPLPRYEVPKLNTALYHRTVFTMPLPGKREQAEITVYFDKETLQTVYVCIWQAIAVLCGEDDDASLQNGLRSFYQRNPSYKEVFFFMF